MKKFLVAALAIMTLSFGFTSCEDDLGGDSNYTIVSDPASVVAGTYNGQYTRTLDGESKTAAASIVIAAGSSKEYVNVTFKACDELGVPEASVPCNIMQKGNSRFIITNGIGAKNPLGTSFRLYVDNSTDVQANFVLSVKDGRKNFEFDFEFLGSK